MHMPVYKRGRGGTRVTQQCTSPRLFLQVIPSVNSPRVGKKAAPTAFPTPTPSLGTLRWHGGHREEGTDSASPLGPQSSGQGPCPWEPEASPRGLPGAPRCSLEGTVGGGGTGCRHLMARTPSSLQPPTPLQLWSQSAQHIRLLILEAMNAGVSPKSFGVSTSAPNTMRALIISMLSFCWGMEWGGWE